MDQVLAQVSQWLVNQGPMGLLVLVSWVVAARCFQLFTESNAKLNECQEKRITERGEYATVMANNAHAIEGLTDAVLQGRLTSGRRG